MPESGDWSWLTKVRKRRRSFELPLGNYHSTRRPVIGFILGFRGAFDWKYSPWWADTLWKWLNEYSALWFLFLVLYEVRFELHPSTSVTSSPICWDNLARGEVLCDLMTAEEDGSLVVQLESWIWRFKPWNNTVVQDLMRSIVDAIVNAIKCTSSGIEIMHKEVRLWFKSLWYFCYLSFGCCFNFKSNENIWDATMNVVCVGASC